MTGYIQWRRVTKSAWDALASYVANTVYLVQTGTRRARLYVTDNAATPAAYSLDFGTSAGISFQLDLASTTMGDGGTGILRFNNATAASVTAIAITAESIETGNPDVSAITSGWSSGIMTIVDRTDPSKRRQYNVTAVADNGAWLQFTVSGGIAVGTFVNGDLVDVYYVPTSGAAGSNTQVMFNDAGTMAGDAGLTYDKTTDALTIGGVVKLPTTSSAAIGVIEINSTRFLHAYGTTNLFVGSGAGNFSLTAAATVAIGQGAGASLTSGSSNTLVGQGAGSAVETGANNTIIGRLAGSAALASTVLIGAGTTQRLQITSSNFFAIVTPNAGQTSGNCIGIGSAALDAVTTGDANTALGTSAASAITDGSFNVALGTGALQSETSGSRNMSIGSYSLNVMNGGDDNVAVGTSSLRAVSTGDGNVGIGSNAGRSITTGIQNTEIGYNSAGGSGITTGSYNVVIGAVTGLSSSLANTIVIGDGQGNQRLTMDASAAVFTRAVRVPTYTVATLPSASGAGAGAIIYVSNETGGATTAFSDGTNWRRHADRTIVS